MESNVEGQSIPQFHLAMATARITFNGVAVVVILHTDTKKKHSTKSTNEMWYRYCPSRNRDANKRKHNTLAGRQSGKRVHFHICLLFTAHNGFALVAVHFYRNPYCLRSFLTVATVCADGICAVRETTDDRKTIHSYAQLTHTHSHSHNACYAHIKQWAPRTLCKQKEFHWTEL